MRAYMNTDNLFNPTVERPTNQGMLQIKEGIAGVLNITLHIYKGTSRVT